MTREKYIVSLNNSGITNRIKSILSVLRLSKHLSRTPLIYWPSNSLTQCEFSDLFKNNINVINDEAGLIRIYKEEKWKKYRHVSKRLMKTKCNYILIGTWRLLTLPNEVPQNFARVLPSVKKNDIDFEFNRIPKQIRKEYTELINTLILVDYITDQIEEFSSKFNSNTVSVSVRSWIESKDRSKFFNIAEFYEIMDRMDNANFFMSCDSPEVLNRFAEKYGDRLIYYPKRTFMGDRNSVNGVQDVLIDLYLLSKNNRIIVSFGSTFSEMAWWFGNCQAEVELIGINEKHKKSILVKERKARTKVIFRNLLYKRYLKLKTPTRNVIHFS